MSSLFVRLCAVQLILLAGCLGFQWTSDLRDVQLNYACVGDDVVLPFGYKPSAGDDVFDFDWFFQSSSQERVAKTSLGRFIPMPSFANRVKRLSGAELSLSHVTSGDTGNYSVKITGLDAAGIFFQYHRTVMVIVTDCWGFQWTSDLPVGTAKYACVGDELALPWKTYPEDLRVISIKWHFQGSSQELMAMFSNGHFDSMASYANRVQHLLSGAALSLSHVTTSDTGNYSVEIAGRDASGTLFAYRRTMMVVIAENDTVMTTDGELHAMLEPQAIYSNTTGQWSLVVSCGHFTFPSLPPFDMEWTTPSGAVVPSDGYKDGYFQLHVTSGGDYTCTIPQHAAADLCLHNATRHATVHVDKMEARMTVLEGEVRQLRQREVDLTDYVHTLETRLDEQDSNQTQSLQALASKVAREVAFAAYLGNDHHGSSGTIKFDSGVYNRGSCYSESSGNFTAPVDGLYFFSLTSAAIEGDDTFNTATINLGRWPICTAGSRNRGQVASCAAAVHVYAGERVYAWSSNHLSSLYTSFTGFLVTSD